MVFTKAPSTLKEFACAFADTSQEFMETFVQQIEAIHPDASELRSEICGAVWGATRAAFQTSLLEPNEQEIALRAVMTCLLPFWEQHCTSKCSGNEDVGTWLTGLSTPYLESLRLGNVVGTANSIVDALMAKINIATASRPLAGRMLATALAHRIFSDIRRINVYVRLGAPV